MRFTLPRDIYFGSGAISELSKLKGYQRAFVVTGGSSMRKGGFLQKTQDALKSAGADVMIFEGVEADPSIETVMKGAKAMRGFAPDIIVAIGGGSPMDAAKAMWVFYEYPEKSFEDIKEPFSLPKLRQKAVFAAIPSTSGSASEVTAFSVITDYSTHIKYPLADFEITPDIAVIDTDIPLTMPKTLTADTGMDALTHAVEAYTASGHSGFSDPLALAAASEVFEYLPASYGGNEEARRQMHISQCLAGMAFSNALLGIAHSLAHKTGAVFGLSHGCCNAILLPYVIEYNSKACEKRYEELARFCGAEGSVNALVERVKALAQEVGIKQSYKENGVSQSLFEANAEEIAKNAAADPCTASNPRKADAADLKRILGCAYYGKKVDF